MALNNSWANYCHSGVDVVYWCQLWLRSQLQLNSTELPNYSWEQQASQKLKMAAPSTSNCTGWRQQWEDLKKRPLRGNLETSQTSVTRHKWRKQNEDGVSSQRKNMAVLAWHHSQHTRTQNFSHALMFNSIFLFLNHMQSHQSSTLCMHLKVCWSQAL